VAFVHPKTSFGTLIELVQVAVAKRIDFSRMIVSTRTRNSYLPVTVMNSVIHDAMVSRFASSRFPRARGSHVG
jgi:hypothetical protein